MGKIVFISLLIAEMLCYGCVAAHAQLYTDFLKYGETRVIPASNMNQNGESFSPVKNKVKVNIAEQTYYWDGSLEKGCILVSDPNNKHRRILVNVGGNNLVVIVFDSQNRFQITQYKMDLKTGEISIINPFSKEEPKNQKVMPGDGEVYLAAVRDMEGAVNSAYDIASSSKKEQIKPIADYLKMIESHFSTVIPVTANWRARIDEQPWNDSRGITWVTIDAANNELILRADLDANKAGYGKGEVYISVSDVPQLGQGELDINGKKLVMEVFIPSGFIGDPKSPDHFRLFLKSGDSWAPVYGIWRKVDYTEEGTWITMEFDPMADPASWKDANFNPSKVWEFGLSITKGSGQYQGDGLRIRNIRIESGQKVAVKEPIISSTPPVDISSFINLSGRNLNFNEYNYGWCVGEFPVIWGQGADGGFSNPVQREKLRLALMDLKSKGINTVRMMALFGDLRTGILQDENGNFIYDKHGNLQFDSKVYADVKAFFDVLHETGMKAVVGLFDFRVADDISSEGTRDASYAVGEHPEIFTDRKTQDAFVKLFKSFFSKIYSKGFVNYNINDTVLFWEVMNEPEAACAVDFNKVVSFNERFFDLIHQKAPGAKVTTSSLTVDSAFRFWKDKVDVISVHHYPGIESLTLSKPVGNYGFGTKPVFWTEFGDVNLRIPDVLNDIYASSSQGILFWQDSYYQFSADDYQSWVTSHNP